MKARLGPHGPPGDARHRPVKRSLFGAVRDGLAALGLLGRAVTSLSNETGEFAARPAAAKGPDMDTHDDQAIHELIGTDLRDSLDEELELELDDHALDQFR